MSQRNLYILLLVTVCAMCGVIFLVLSLSHHDPRVLSVTYLDVGQGDATFIESPSGTQVLVDGGPNASVLRALGREMGFFDRDIDLMVITHPDVDHIAGLVDVLKRYKIHTILMTENTSDTPASALLAELIKDEGATIGYARRGQVYDLGAGEGGSTTLAILFPDRNPEALESNTSSIVSQVRYGSIEFMLTGDSPRAIEEYLVSISGDTLESEVLKAGHHGSRTSSADAFIEAVHPQYVIVSAGKDNRYGHPHKEVMEAFARRGITTKNTADSGSIHFTSDGVSVWTK